MHLRSYARSSCRLRALSMPTCLVVTRCVPLETRIPRAVFARETVDDLLKQYEALKNLNDKP